MCTSKCREKVRQFDAFAQPVSMAYKQQYEFNSALGGCCSILLAFCIVAYLVQAWIKIFVEVEFATTDTCDYKSYLHNGDEVF